jgi:hypothetical protein
MAEPDAPPAALLAARTDPRRVALADLVARLVEAVTAGARRYEAAVARTEAGALRQGLERLGHAKRAQVAALAPLARALEISALPEPGAPAGTPPPWGVLLGEAFQGERRIRRLAEETARLVDDPGVGALAARLAAAAARDGGEVRGLYLRYS